MKDVIKTRIIKIGNFYNISISETIANQVGLKDEVEITLQENQLVVRPVQNPRQGWAEQFKLMAENGDDRLLDAKIPTEFDKTEWER
jgi:antitoxin MazE